MRVRSSAASAWERSARAATRADFRPGRRGQVVRRLRLAQVGARLVEPLPGLGRRRRAPCRRRLRLPSRRGAPSAGDRARRGSARAAAPRWRPRPRPTGAPGPCPDTSVLSRSRLRIAASASAAFTRPISSSSSRRTSRSPAATLSLRATSTSAMRPGACAPMRTSPPDGSTRPAAEAAQPLLGASSAWRSSALAALRFAETSALTLSARLGAEGLRHVIADAERQDGRDDQHIE